MAGPRSLPTASAAVGRASASGRVGKPRTPGSDDARRDVGAAQSVAHATVRRYSRACSGPVAGAARIACTRARARPRTGIDAPSIGQWRACGGASRRTRGGCGAFSPERLDAVARIPTRPRTSVHRPRTHPGRRRADPPVPARERARSVARAPRCLPASRSPPAGPPREVRWPPRGPSRAKARRATGPRFRARARTPPSDRPHSGGRPRAPQHSHASIAALAGPLRALDHDRSSARATRRHRSRNSARHLRVNPEGHRQGAPRGGRDVQRAEGTAGSSHGFTRLGRRVGPPTLSATACELARESRPASRHHCSKQSSP